MEECGDSEWASRRSGTVCVGVLFWLLVAADFGRVWATYIALG